MKNYEVHVQNMKNGVLEHDYDIKVTDIVYLNHSYSSQWSESSKGELVGTLIDDGNGVSIQLSDKKKPIYLDYKQMAEVQMLLFAAMERDYVTQIRESKSIITYSGLAE